MKYFTNLQDFYTSKEWKQCKEIIRNQRLNKEGFILDEVTGRPILKKYDMVFHHKIELTLANVNDPEISLNPANIQIVTHETHNEIHKRFGFYERKIYLVHGNICSGKTSYIDSVACKDDLIVDMDKLWMAVSNNEKYVKPARLKPVVFALRDCLLEQIKMRNGNWFCAYISSTNSSPLARKRMIDRLGVNEIVHIETDEATCLKRLYDNPNGRDIPECEAFIKEYARTYKDE